MNREDGRAYNELRSTKITKNYIKHLPGSVLIEIGHTKVICAATFTDGIPKFLKGTNQGWLTAEYSMLPYSSPNRIPRESVKGKIGGRTHEVQRLIGRALRSITDMTQFQEKTIIVDCDVIQADGGTRTASITGAFVALYELFKDLKTNGVIEKLPIKDYVAAVSVGIVDKNIYLDLSYEEDSIASVDLNVAMTGSGKLVEIQGTAEGDPFSFEEFLSLFELAKSGISELIKIQKGVIGELE
jgi:ribonuclease PH